jgi:hypothetical protein
MFIVTLSQACWPEPYATQLEIVERFHERGISAAQRRGQAVRRRSPLLVSAYFTSWSLRILSAPGATVPNPPPRSAAWEDLRITLLTAVGDDTRLTGWRVIRIKQALGEEARKQRVADLRRFSWQAPSYGLFHTPLAI